MRAAAPLPTKSRTGRKGFVTSRQSQVVGRKSRLRRPWRRDSVAHMTRLSRREFLAGAAAVAVAGRSARAADLRTGQHPLGIDHERDGLLYIPTGYRPEVPMPLAVVFHGAGGTAQSVMYTFPLADRHGVIILA